MGQYSQFRTWSRASSGGEKALVTVAVGVVLALTAYSLMPTGEPTTDSLQAQAAEQGQAGVVGLSPGGSGTDAGSVTGPAAAGGPSGAAGAGSGASGGGTAQGSARGGAPAAGAAQQPASGGAQGAAAGGTGACAVKGATAIGVTATTVTVASVLLNLGGPIGNGAVGIASPEQQQQMSDAVVADLNARGGAACRKIIVKYYSANPLDPSSAQNACLQIAQAKVYAVVDGSGFAYPAGAADCIAQRKIPIVGAPGPVPSEAKEYYPYLMSMSYDPAQSFRNGVYGMKARGFFDRGKGFKKLGLYMDDCGPEVNDALIKALGEIGIKKSDMSIYSFTCPSSGFVAPSEASAAVVQHRQDGVTHVIPVTGGGSFKPYSTFAENQGFRPKYTIGDYNGMPITTTGDTGPDRDNFDGTVMVTSTKIGMESSGFSDPASEECKALFKRRGLNPAWVISGFHGGRYCNMYKVFAAGATKAPSLTRENLAKGVGSLGKVAMGYIEGDAIFSQSDLVGGDFSWVVQYRKTCNCWKVVDRTLRPSVK